MTEQPAQIPADERDLTDRLHGTAVAHPDEEADVSSAGAGPIGRVADTIRQRPLLLLAAVAAGFVLGRLIKRAARSRG